MITWSWTFILAHYSSVSHIEYLKQMHSVNYRSPPTRHYLTMLEPTEVGLQRFKNLEHDLNTNPNIILQLILEQISAVLAQFCIYFFFLLLPI